MQRVGAGHPQLVHLGLLLHEALVAFVGSRLRDFPAMIFLLLPALFFPRLPVFRPPQLAFSIHSTASTRISCFGAARRPHTVAPRNDGHTSARVRQRAYSYRQIPNTLPVLPFSASAITSSSSRAEAG